MKLTRVLMFYIRKKHIPGKIDIGKHRAPTPVRDWMKRQAVEDIIREQKNMDLLRTPCISEAEDRAFRTDPERLAALSLAQLEERREKNWLKHQLLEPQLMLLNDDRSWE